MTNKIAVAMEILRQLGGNKFKAMTGARNFVGDKDKITFHLPKAKDRINVVRITLKPTDTYAVEFMNVRRYVTTPIRTVEDVYADNLREVFETNTGLRTSL